MLEYLLSMMIFAFAFTIIIEGIFTAYFGSGKSRAIGAILIVIGLIVGAIFLWCAGLLTFIELPLCILSFKGIVANAILAVIGAVIGALIALGIFLLAIMKT